MLKDHLCYTYTVQYDVRNIYGTRPVGSIRKVVRLVTGANEIAARGSGGAL